MIKKECIAKFAIKKGKAPVTRNEEHTEKKEQEVCALTESSSPVIHYHPGNLEVCFWLLSREWKRHTGFPERQSWN